MTADVGPGRASEPSPLEVPASFELFRVRIPMHEPFAAAHGIEDDRDLILIRARSADGLVGWGECSTLSAAGYTAEHTAGAWSVLRDELAPAFLSGRALDTARDNPMAFTGIEVACIDLALRRAERPLLAEFGGWVTRVPVGVVVGVQSSIDDLLVAVDRRVREGFAQVKCKVAGPGWLEHLTTVRGAWPDLALAVDANGSLDRAELLAAAGRIDDLGLDYLEQPLTADDLDGLAVVVRALATPVALDESLGTATDLDRAARIISARFVVNIKPGRLGGVDATRAVLHRVEQLGLSAFVGGMLESGVGRATALAVATSPACNLVGDLGPSDRYFPRDVITAPFALVEGTLTLPTGPGIGVDVDEDALDRFTVEHATVAR